MSNRSRTGTFVITVVAVGALLSGAACRPAQPPATAQPRPGAAEPELLIAELRALPIRTAPEDRLAEQLRRRFEVLYRTQPAAAEGAPALVRDERELRGKIILDALTRADTTHSTAVLTAIASDDRIPGGARRYALGCLSRASAR